MIIIPQANYSKVTGLPVHLLSEFTQSFSLCMLDLKILLSENLLDDSQVPWE